MMRWLPMARITSSSTVLTQRRIWDASPGRPMGLRLACILTDANGSLLLVPIDGAEIRTIKIVSGATLNPTGAAWSPDGEWIVFSGHTDPGFDLYIMQTDGTDLHQVTDTAGIWEGAADWR